MKRKPRGWDALEVELREQGLKDIEIQKAKVSFEEGIKILSKLFLENFNVERK